MTLELVVCFLYCVLFLKILTQREKYLLWKLTISDYLVTDLKED